MRTDILGIGFDDMTLRTAASRGIALMGRLPASYVVTPNSEIVYDAINDPEYAAIINEADMVLPDGIGVIYASRILGTPLTEKVAGVDFAYELLKRMANLGLSVYFFGGKPGIAEAAAEKLTAQLPDLNVCGCHDGYFDDDWPIIMDINSKKPDCLFVCLGAPKQERWMAEHRHLVNTKLMVGLGGTLDSFAGTVKRAPKIFIKLGLEWFYRLIKEPWRFKRMLRLPKFLWRVIVFKFKGENKK